VSHLRRTSGNLDRTTERQPYTRGAVVERLFRDARAAEIDQGTPEAQRMVISPTCCTACNLVLYPET
jgi:hypothetical protein